MCFTVTRSRGATWGTSSVTTVRNTTFSCSTLLWARLWTSAGGVCSAVPYMNTAVPGTRSGGSAARSASSILRGSLLQHALAQDLAPAFPGRHQQEDDRRDRQGDPAAVAKLQHVRGEEKDVHPE